MYANRFDSSPDEVSAYVRSLLDLVGERDPVMLLGEMSSRLRELLSGLSDETLRRPEAAGKWSIADVVAHLADSELVYAFRYRMIVGHDEPALAGYDQDAWAQRYATIPIDESLELFDVVRKSNLRLLHALTPEQWLRASMHSERGRETIERLAKLHAAHDIVHSRQIARIRDAAAEK